MSSEVVIVPEQAITLTVKIQVNNLAGVMSLYDQIRVYRSNTVAADGTPGNFTLVDTIALVTDRPIYLYVDQAPGEDAWYQISYVDSTGTNPESSRSDPTQGVPSPALSVLSVTELKTNFLFGVDLTDDSGNPYPDSLFAFYIESAYQMVKDRLDIELLPEFVQDERHDFYKPDYDKYIWIKTDRVPVISVQRLRLVLPTNQPVIDYALENIHIDHNAGQLEVVPGGGQITLGQTGAFLPLVFGGQDYLPQAFRLDYTVGFADGKVPANIREVIGMLASFGPFGIAGDLLVGAGIASQSLSLDGISQTVNTTSSATNSGYGSRLVQYKGQLKEAWPVLYNKYHPRNMIVC